MGKKGKERKGKNPKEKERKNFIKSKTVILLPTGLISWFPSGVKQRSPFLYSVPKRFEN